MALTDIQASKLTHSDGATGHFFKFWLPYLFQKIELSDVKWAYLPLNRIYKPLGIASKDWVDYNTFIRSHGVKFSKNPGTFDGIWTHADDEGRLWLYEDALVTKQTYFARLERLMSRTISTIAIL